MSARGRSLRVSAYGGDAYSQGKCAKCEMTSRPLCRGEYRVTIDPPSTSGQRQETRSRMWTGQRQALKMFSNDEKCISFFYPLSNFVVFKKKGFNRDGVLSPQWLCQLPDVARWTMGFGGGFRARLQGAALCCERSLPLVRCATGRFQQQTPD